MRTNILCSALLLCLASPALGQQDICGDLPQSADFTNRVGLVLFAGDSVAQEIRADMGIQQLDPGATAVVITTKNTCRTIGREVERRLKTAPDWQEIRTNGWRVQYFEFGPFYAAYVVLNPPPGVEIQGYGQLFLYDSSDMSFIGIVLQ